MDDSEIMNEYNIILDIIFYPNKYLTDENEYNIIWKADVSPILISKEM